MRIAEIEIIPNWHPVAVHFAIALLFTAVLLLLIGSSLGVDGRGSKLVLVGRWNLLLGAVAAAWAVLTGWLAYNGVAHDTVAHQAMTVHLRWANPTVVLFVGLAAWFWIRRGAKAFGVVALVLLLVGALALARTGYLGGENVYRYGLGVQSTPASRAAANQDALPAFESREEEHTNENHNHAHEDKQDDHSMPHAH